MSGRERKMRRKVFFFSTGVCLGENRVRNLHCPTRSRCSPVAVSSRAFLFFGGALSLVLLYAGVLSSECCLVRDDIHDPPNRSLCRTCVVFSFFVSCMFAACLPLLARQHFVFRFCFCLFICLCVCLFFFILRRIGKHKA